MTDVSQRDQVECDVLLIGAGIMSATVGALLKELDPGLSVVVLERLDRVAGESSHAMNNAGTGHSALCEINYTPRGADGAIDVRKAVKVMECFEVSRQFWSYLARRPGFTSPRRFVRPVPHMSFVWGEDDATFLRHRFDALIECPLFHGMRYSEHRDDLAEWMPLVMEARDPEQPVAATRSDLGTDVDFGALTRALFDHLLCTHGVGVSFGHEVQSLARDASGRWVAEAEADGTTRRVRAKFVFIGAGGAALTLLDRSDIPEGDGYGGFPVSGEWLVCKNPALVARHDAKVYGKAKVGAPPMSMPHLDTRYIDGKRSLMFGPFAGFSTRFLKEGSYLDLPRSITADNLRSMLGAGLNNLSLTKYLIGQVTQSFEDKVEALLEYVPFAQPEDWELAVAGQRVQVIKKDDEDGGRLEFGTEIISAKDNSLAALLGASPGASTAVSIALDLLVDCFPEGMETPAWRRKLAEMIPSYGRRLSDDRALAQRLRAHSHEALGLGLRDED